MKLPRGLGPRRRTAEGSAIVEMTWLGLLLFIPLVYTVITVVTVQRSAYGVTEATRAAGRAYILAPDVATAQQRAFRAAWMAMHDPGAGNVEPRAGERSAVRATSLVSLGVPDFAATLWQGLSPYPRRGSWVRG